MRIPIVEKVDEEDDDHLLLVRYPHLCQPQCTAVQQYGASDPANYFYSKVWKRQLIGRPSLTGFGASYLLKKFFRIPTLRQIEFNNPSTNYNSASSQWPNYGISNNYSMPNSNPYSGMNMNMSNPFMQQSFDNSYQSLARPEIEDRGKIRNFFNTFLKQWTEYS